MRAASVSGLHLDEVEAIMLAQRLERGLIVDEREASSTAQMLGVKPIGTIRLLLAPARDLLTFCDFGESLYNLLASGFWLTVDVYSKISEEA